MACSDPCGHSFINSRMNTFVKVLRHQEIGNPVASLVVDQYGAQQCHFCLKVVRGRAIFLVVRSVSAALIEFEN